MNELEQLVPSLDLCQKLKAAGFPQNTVLRWTELPQGWVNGGGGVPYEAVGGYVNRVQPCSVTLGVLSEWLCAAPTLSELLDVLEPSQSSAEKMVALAHAVIALHDEAHP